MKDIYSAAVGNQATVQIWAVNIFIYSICVDLSSGERGHMLWIYGALSPLNTPVQL